MQAKLVVTPLQGRCRSVLCRQLVRQLRHYGQQVIDVERLDRRKVVEAAEAYTANGWRAVAWFSQPLVPS
jgi:hypothetical protein